ncbi:MBL fold metallo-hydrolase [Fundicoccus culcitae]|uniref:MBL fold metallo-hydrolase n=1 Tax=Fundicoccus culcitae TaxID=2969821 RepID=A0ABY5P4G5_9LACT|nr:MBL fold metallo-hydrolase [Fundicoccus culcitae]UUX33606.1 MBL fold metallo-hydrolase [Fundicoccus culcitae]
MELTVIGYHGGSAPADHATSSYLLKVDGFQLLLDCGAGTMSQLQKVADIDQIDHVLITHYHYDHFSDGGAFVYNRLVKKMLNPALNPLTIFTQEDGVISPTLKMGENSQLVYIDEDSQLSLEGMSIRFMVTTHPVKCLAVRIEKDAKVLVYTADSSLTAELIEFSMGADLLVTECSLYSGYSGAKSGHMNTEEVAELINRSGAKKTILSHLPIYGDHQVMLETVKGLTDKEVVLAEKFLTVEI